MKEVEDENALKHMFDKAHLKRSAVTAPSAARLPVTSANCEIAHFLVGRNRARKENEPGCTIHVGIACDDSRKFCLYRFCTRYLLLMLLTTSVTL
jgi:hypothetical protein